MFSQKSQLNHALSLTSSYVVVKLVSMILGLDDIKPQDESDSSDSKFGTANVWTLIGRFFGHYSGGSSNSIVVELQSSSPAGGNSSNTGKQCFFGRAQP